MVRLAVFEKQIFFRLGVKRVFENNPDIHVAGEACSETSLFELLAQTPVDIMLLGVNLPNDTECVKITHRLRSDYPHVKILAVANENTGETVQAMMAAGINGYIGKRQANRNELEKAVLRVAAGGKYIGRIDGGIMIGKAVKLPTAAREVEMLRAALKNRRRQIANRFFLIE